MADLLANLSFKVYEDFKFVNKSFRIFEASSKVCKFMESERIRLSLILFS
jgi:hypothetical protein